MGWCLLLSALSLVSRVTVFVVINEALVAPASHDLIRIALREHVSSLLFAAAALRWKQVLLFTSLAGADVLPAETNSQERLFHLNNEVFLPSEMTTSDHFLPHALTVVGLGRRRVIE